MKFKKIIALSLVTLVFFILFWDTGISYGANNPDVSLYIQGDKAHGGAMFTSQGDMGKGLWAPGVTRKGCLRIFNNYSHAVNVRSLALEMKLEKLNGNEYHAVEDENLIELYAKNMKIKIKKGRLLIFEDTIYDKSFLEMMYKPESNKYKGYEFPLVERFRIGKGDDTDLEYTVHMDENAGNELQGLRATVNFLINTKEQEESQVPPSIPSGNNTVEELEEEQIEVIPDLPDIDGHWAHDCIVTLVKKGIVKGYPDGSIRPQNHITRAETATVIARGFNLPNKADVVSPYSDRLPKCAKGYIVSVTQKGIFKGYTNEFKPDRNISREEMATVLARAFKLKSRQDEKIFFSDGENIAKWALESVKAGVENKIIFGYPDNTFRPKGEITRAEAFAMICRAMGYHIQHKR